ncbi:MAG: carbohydrate binding family 9 domain-containing protein [FCB group bacterium]|nr:carbohydrate binding family 9 domain-containing protein [FCB group bacterium]
MNCLKTHLLSLIGLLFFAIGFCAKGIPERVGGQEQVKTGTITRTATPPVIDGILTDKVWSLAVPLSDFLQEDPDNLAPPTEATEVRMLYDDKYIYIGVRMFDSEPDKIARRLAKRDDWMVGFEGASDWFSVDIDSRFDHQTGFVFVVNAAGVQVDAMIFDDSDFDGEWDTVWDSDVQIDSLGWTLELRIPFSILRFTSKPDMTWGLNLSRYIQRKDETISWNAQPRGVQGLASRFGLLKGLQNIPDPQQLEFRPYLLSGTSNEKYDLLEDPQEITSDRNIETYGNFLKNIGLDIKYGIGSNSTMDITVNPDFGQIEADPAEINLTYFETRFQEKRPFFMENSTIFDTPIEIFYSRRIGQRNAMIKSAGKITGKTPGGYSYGILGALTTPDSDGSWGKRFFKGRNDQFFVSRVLKDILHGNSYLGLLGTYTRDAEGSSNAISSDGFISLADNQVMLEYQVAASGSEGERGTAAVSEFSYKHPKFFKVWLDMEYFDKDFDIRHAGYNRRNDYRALESGVEFRRQDPWGIIKYATLQLEFQHRENNDRLLLGRRLDANYHITLVNNWRFGGGLNTTPDLFSDRTTYDWTTAELGPEVKLPSAKGGFLYIRSDFRKPLRVRVSGGFGRNRLDDFGWNRNINVDIRPTEFIDLSLSTNFGSSHETFRWLEPVTDEADEVHYMFAESENRLEVYTLWASGNLSRDISLQLYSEYFKSSNEFSNYSELVTAGQFPVYSGYNPYSPDPGEGELLDPNLDVNFFSRYTSLNTNFVLRWEYKSGSILYFVYSVSKQVNGRKFGTISDFLKFTKAGEFQEIYYTNALFLKIDYWFNL